ncbi:MAG TPA: glycosyltransferase family 2 protein [Solirubrobacteraceae bacterium]|nr:glycosyltransferase family 2 protein [Solirubrobacteraceae bacterium]
MTPEIDVVVVVYNRYDLTEACLEHLDRQTVPHRLIICDNGSTDGTSERLQADWPAARLLRLERNSPFAVACNMGVKAGTGDVVVLLNNDVQCRPDFLEAAVAPLLADPTVGSVATLMLQPGEQLIDSFGMSCDPTLAGYPRLHGRPAAAADTADSVLVGPPGTATAYRRTAWEQVGGLDERLFAYGEDFDLALRLASAGWRTAAAAGAVGVHLGSATHRHRSRRQRYHGGFGRGYLLRRYGVLRGRHALRALLTETLVATGDLAISRDTAAFRGRLAGWHGAAGLPRLPRPPEETIDHSIDLARSFALRRGAYGLRSA